MFAVRKFLNRFARSNRAQLEALFPRLSRFALTLTGNKAAASEILAEIYVKIKASPEDYRDSDWFVRTALGDIYRLWLKALAEGRLAIGSHDNLAKLLNPSASSEQEAKEPDTGKFLAALPPQQRAALLLVYGEKMTYREAADILDVPVEAVMAAVAGARAALAGGYFLVKQDPGRKKTSSKSKTKARNRTRSATADKIKTTKTEHTETVPADKTANLDKPETGDNENVSAASVGKSEDSKTDIPAATGKEKPERTASARRPNQIQYPAATGAPPQTQSQTAPSHKGRDHDSIGG